MSTFYVYELIDPRDGAVFYVGKGKGARILAHENDARKLDVVCSEKINRIRDIWRAGYEVKRRAVEHFASEASAYEFERARIEEIGLDRLTNIVPGGAGGLFVPRPEWSRWDDLSWIPSHKEFLRLLAVWLKLSNGGRNAVGVESDNTLVRDVLNVAFKNFFPEFWRRLLNDLDTLKQCATELRRHGVELGCA